MTSLDNNRIHKELPAPIVEGGLHMVKPELLPFYTATCGEDLQKYT